MKTELMEQKNKFIRKVLKEDMFKYSTTKLGKSMEKVLKQNITLDIEELYFTDVEEAPDHEVCLTSQSSGSFPRQAKRVKVVAKLKDFSNHRRPVSPPHCLQTVAILRLTHHICSCQMSLNNILTL